MPSGFLHYPSGPLGVALLLLRVLVAGLLAADAAALLNPLHSPDFLGWAIGVVTIACSILGAIGLCSRAALSGASALAVARLADQVWGIGLALRTAPILPPAIALTITISLALAGPGAYSFDAYLFGRREIKIPPRRIDAEPERPFQRS